MDKWSIVVPKLTCAGGAERHDETDGASARRPGARAPGAAVVTSLCYARSVNLPAVLDAPKGEVIAGKYRIERVLGSGGMGTVVAATHLELGGLVALKFLNPGVVGQAEALARFQREARAMFALRGENVGRILDVGRLPSKGPFIVMEYLEGHDLERVASAGPIAIARAVGYVLQACAAVAEAHAAGIVHRDLKPQNLFVTSRPDGTEVVKVLDFGISKMSSEDVSLTHTSATIGSPRYMAPEQYESASLADARTDIWALGAVLFKLLTGHVPYDGDSAYAVLSKILREPPPSPRVYRDDIPERLAAAVLQALSRRPADRFPSIPDFAAAIAPFSGGAALASLPPPARRVTGAKPVAFATTIGMGAGVGTTGALETPHVESRTATDTTSAVDTTRRIRGAAPSGEGPVTRSMVIERGSAEAVADASRAAPRSFPVALTVTVLASVVALGGAIALRWHPRAPDGPTSIGADAIDVTRAERPASSAPDPGVPAPPASADPAAVALSSAAAASGAVAVAAPSPSSLSSSAPSPRASGAPPARGGARRGRPPGPPSASPSRDLMKENW